MNYDEKVNYFLNKMKDLIQEAKEQGLDFIFLNRPNDYYKDEEIQTIYSYEPNFEIDIV